MSRPRFTIALAALPLALVGATLARAQSAPAAAFAPTVLPTFAQAPPNDPSPWAGLSFGSEISMVGGKGLKGGVGGDAWLAYDRELSNNVVVSVQAFSGYAPALSKWSRFNGVNYAGANVVLGYDMGRFEPYVIAGVGLAKANLGPPGRFDAKDSVNDLFVKDGAPLETATTVGAGFNYAVTNNLSMGMQFTATQFSGGGPNFANAPVAAPIQ